jgi:hypothetical protein
MLLYTRMHVCGCSTTDSGQMANRLGMQICTLQCCNRHIV